MKGSFLTIEGPTKGQLRERGSRFLSFAFRVDDERSIHDRLEELRSEFFDATHHCYAWMLGPDGERWRVFDDGEPGHSAGDPILGQIKSRSLTNVLVVVVRYYGGTNLGVGGLVKAYRESASAALDIAKMIEVLVRVRWKFVFDYEAMPDVMKAVKTEGILVVEKTIGEQCVVIAEVPVGIDPRSWFNSRGSGKTVVVYCER